MGLLEFASSPIGRYGHISPLFQQLHEIDVLFMMKRRRVTPRCLDLVVHGRSSPHCAAVEIAGRKAASECRGIGP
jgi:hypothetical protein